MRRPPPTPACRSAGPPLLGPAGLVGRDRELATLAGALARPPAVVLVEGEAGIGKSRLLQELLATGDHRALLAVCSPPRESLTLAPIVDAVRRSRESVAGLRLSELAGALRPLFPEWAADLPPAPEPLPDAGAARHRLLRALVELIGCLDRSVLVVEDVHWADPATVEFLLLLHAAGPRSPVPSLVVSYRPEEVDGSLLRLSSRLPAGRTQLRVALPPLDLAGVGQQVSSMLAGEAVSSELAAFLHEHTDGVPLAVEESVRLLRDRADLVRRQGEWGRRSRAPLQVPPTVRDAARERLARLGRVPRRIVEAAAVLAEPVGEATLREVADLTGEQTRRGVREALASGLLHDDEQGGIAFRHALLGQAAYEAIPAPERRRLHGRAAASLQRRQQPPLAQLARHFQQAQEIAQWTRYAEAAADVAVASGDDATAVALLHDLLDATDHPPQRHGRLARKLGQAAVIGRSVQGEPGERVAAALRAAIARAGVGRTDRGQLRLLHSQLLVQQRRLDAAYAEIERSIPDLRGRPALVARAMIGMGWPWLGGRPVAEHRAWLDRAAPLLPRLRPSSDWYALVADRATALLMLGDAAGWRAAGRLPARAGTAAARRDLARGFTNLSQVAVVWGHYGRAQTWLRTAAELVDATTYPSVERAVQFSAAYLDYCTGTWTGLARAAARLQAAEDAAPLDWLDGRLIQGLVAQVTGESATAEPALREVVARFPRPMPGDDSLIAAAALARLQLSGGAAADALATTEAGMAAVAATGNWLWAADLVRVRVDALVATGAGEAAQELVQQFAGWLVDRDAPAPAAALVACRASLAEAAGRLRPAAALFGRAARAWDGLPRPYDAALARERQACCLLAGGPADPVLPLLSEVFQALSTLGAKADADRVARCLRERGVPVRRRAGGRPSYGDQLSPRELDVVRLLVTGKTDQQIAERLFVSPKTVRYHLGSARRKLNAPSRTALAVAAVRVGITPPR